MFELTDALRELDSALLQPSDNYSTKSQSYKTWLTEPSVTAGNKGAPSFTERGLALETATLVAEGVAGSLVNSGSDKTEHNA